MVPGEVEDTAFWDSEDPKSSWSCGVFAVFWCIEWIIGSEVQHTLRL